MLRSAPTVTSRDATRGIATAAAPTARLRHGREATRGDSRTGVSTSRMVSQAGIADAVTSASFPGHDCAPSTASPRTSTGQCHRYHENDSRPIARTGRYASNLPTPAPSGRPPPLRMTASVPRVGRSAAYPGNGVALVYHPTATRMAIAPAQPKAVEAARQSRPASARPVRYGAANAPSAPQPNCQARDGELRYAHGALCHVQYNDSANDATTIEPMAAASGTRADRPSRRAIRAEASASGAHSR